MRHLPLALLALVPLGCGQDNGGAQDLSSGGGDSTVAADLARMPGPDGGTPPDLTASPGDAGAPDDASSPDDASVPDDLPLPVSDASAADLAKSPGDLALVDQAKTPIDLTGYDATKPVADLGKGGGCNTNNDCMKADYCDFGNMTCLGPGQCVPRPQLCIQIYDPVCGCDKKTYGNACLAAGAGMNIAHKGMCP